MDLVKSLALKAIVTHGNENIFTTWHRLLDDYHETPSHNIQELKDKNSKLKGDLFEIFCQRYLLRIFGCSHAYLYKECPDDILKQMNFRHRGDFGIDIIAYNPYLQGWIAVQCKYRSFRVNQYQHHRSDVITWKELSTFYALAGRTGPWVKQIVMTTGSEVRKITGHLETDMKLRKKDFEMISVENWYRMFDIEAKTTNQQKEEAGDKPDMETLRKLRIARFG